MGQKRHILSDIDFIPGTALCAHCGPVEFVIRNGAQIPICVHGYRQHKRNARLRRRYGMSADEWDAMLIQQSGRCAACGDPMTDPHVDHDHLTGANRGMLCAACNHGIGHFYDDPNRLRAAIKYLESHLPH